LGERGIGATCLAQTVCKTRHYTALQRVYNMTNEKTPDGELFCENKVYPIKIFYSKYALMIKNLKLSPRPLVYWKNIVNFSGRV